MEKISELEVKIENQIVRILEEKEYVDFLIGRNGDFDICVASVVKKVIEKYGFRNASLILILPYKTMEYLNNKEMFEQYYDYVEISDDAHDVFPKRAFQARNREMVNRADLVVCYVAHNEGGAYKAIKYALAQNKQVINLY